MSDSRYQDSRTSEAAEQAAERPRWRWWLELVVLLAIAFALAQGIKAFVVQPFVIPTGSMEPTIEIGDYVVAEKVSYHFNSPKQGDIVVFTDPRGELPVLIKRVIAVGGQTVDVKDGSVLVDGKPLDEQYTHGKPSLLDSGTLEMPVTVPDGYLWVMGDNRTNSEDSRYFGPIPISTVKAHAVYTYWPIASVGPLK
ncbi:MAG: signal peptidase I [Coriobacteriia bacterium]